MLENEKAGGGSTSASQGPVARNRNSDTRNAYQRWTATLAINEPYVTHEMVKRMLSDFKCKEYAFQHEKGALLGKEHFQIRFTLEHRTTKARLLAIAKLSFQTWTGLGFLDSANWVSDLRLDQERGNKNDSEKYCTKDDGSRVAGPWVYPYRYQGEDLISLHGDNEVDNPYLSWTDDLLDIWSNDFEQATASDDRAVY